MEKLKRLAFAILMIPLASSALTLKYRGETKLPHKMKFRDTKVGGLSALAFHDGRLWALSDDKGRDGEPRFYIFKLTLKGTKVSLAGEDVVTLTGFQTPKGEIPYLDTEGLVRLSSGDLLISSENNNDHKPRALPRIFHVNAEGKFKNDLVLPAKFLPEPLGQQKKGLQNNAGFEGLTITEDGKFLFAAAEAPILTDQAPEATDESAAWVRILRFESHDGGEFTPGTEYAYKLESLSHNKNGLEIFRGVSEILALSEKKLLVLERGLRLQKTTWNQSVSLYEVDLSEAQDISGTSNLSTGSFKAAKKRKILDFETDLVKERGRRAVENFEGLAWGPVLADHKRTLLVISDDNFSKKQKTELLVFTLEGE